MRRFGLSAIRKDILVDHRDVYALSCQLICGGLGKCGGLFICLIRTDGTDQKSIDPSGVHDVVEFGSTKSDVVVLASLNSMMSQPARKHEV